MTAAFDGPDLLVGEIHAVRTFDLRSDGSLWPVFAANRAWSPGVNEAHCGMHRPAGAAGCKCGFWAYGSPAALRDQSASHNVAAVVSCWGRATPGTRGLRAQFARLDAIWLSRRVRGDLRAQVRARYPGVPLFDDRAAMLAAHPLTVLPAYRLPDRRPLRLLAARLFVHAVFAMMLVLGVLPRHVLVATWVSEVHDEAVRVLVYSALAAIARWGYDRWVQGLTRTPFGRLVGVVAVFAAWVWAPFVAVGWQLLLRAPMVIFLVRFVLNRTVRFLPHPAAPPKSP